jgi:hypothetical protein
MLFLSAPLVWARYDYYYWVRARFLFECLASFQLRFQKHCCALSCLEYPIGSKVHKNEHLSRDGVEGLPLNNDTNNVSK